MATLAVTREKKLKKADLPEVRKLPIIGLTKAKAQFSEVFERALKEGPQEITRNGRDAVVMVSKAEWEREIKPKRSLADAFRSSSAFGHGIDFERVKLKPREVEF